MRYCAKCGEKYDNDFSFCLADGEPLPVADQQAQTVRMAERQEDITHLFKTYVVEVGDYVDFNTGQWTLRVTVKAIVKETLADTLFTSAQKETAVHLAFSFEQLGFVHSGSRTKRIGINEIIVPVAESDHLESYSVHSFYLGEDRVVLFTLFVRHINIPSQKVEVSLAYFRYAKNVSTS